MIVINPDAFTLNPDGTLTWNDAIAEPTEADNLLVGTADHVLAETESLSPEAEDMAAAVAESVIEGAFEDFLAEHLDIEGEHELAELIRGRGIAGVFEAMDEALAYAKAQLSPEELAKLEEAIGCDL